MKPVSQDETHLKSAKTPSKKALIFGDIVNVTWRMFVPSVGATVVGVWVDNKLGTTPWFIIAGIMVGSGIAGLLVWRQLSDMSISTDTTKK